MITRRPPDWCGQSASVEQTLAIGAAIARHCRPGDLIALIGELGAGKTQLVRGLARGLGLNDRAVASPTFVLVQEYRPDSSSGGGGATSGGGRTTSGGDTSGGTSGGGLVPGVLPGVLVHVDAYRIRCLEELESMGWQPEALRPGGELRHGAVVALEWADRLGELLGQDYLQVELSHEEPSFRGICITGFDNWQLRIAALAADLNQLVERPQRDWRPCPICSKPASPHTAEFPFCSPQCKMIDLGRWLDSRYVVSRPIDQSDLDADT